MHRCTNRETHTGMHSYASIHTETIDHTVQIRGIRAVHGFAGRAPRGDVRSARHLLTDSTSVLHRFRVLWRFHVLDRFRLLCRCHLHFSVCASLLQIVRFLPFDFLRLLRLDSPLLRLFFRPTPSWLPPGRCKHSIAAKDELRLVCRAVDGR